MTESAPNRIFRQAALDKLASPEQLDELVSVADARGWIGASGLGLVLLTFMAWGFLGTIRTEVQADGILVSEAGRVIGALAPAAGTIEALLAKPGDVVERGQPIARLNQEETRLRLRNAEAAAAEQHRELARRQAALAAQNAALVANMEERRAAYREVIQLTGERLGRLEEQLRGREVLRRQNLVTADQLEGVRVNIAQGRQDISETWAKMAELGSTLLQFQSQAERDMAEARRTTSDADRVVAELSLSLQNRQAVVAPTSGRVTELAVSEGQLVAANQLVLNVETSGRRLQAVIYVPTEHGKKVRPGMRTRLAPSPRAGLTQTRRGTSPAAVAWARWHRRR